MQQYLPGNSVGATIPIQQQCERSEYASREHCWRDYAYPSSNIEFSSAHIDNNVGATPLMSGSVGRATYAWS